MKTNNDKEIINELKDTYKIVFKNETSTKNKQEEIIKNDKNKTITIINNYK